MCKGHLPIPFAFSSLAPIYITGSSSRNHDKAFAHLILVLTERKVGQVRGTTFVGEKTRPRGGLEPKSGNPGLGAPPITAKYWGEESQDLSLPTRPGRRSLGLICRGVSSARHNQAGLRTCV